MSLAAEAAAKGNPRVAAKAACAASRKPLALRKCLEPAQAGFADARTHPLGVASAASRAMPVIAGEERSS